MEEVLQLNYSTQNKHLKISNLPPWDLPLTRGPCSCLPGPEKQVTNICPKGIIFYSPTYVYLTLGFLGKCILLHSASWSCLFQVLLGEASSSRGLSQAAGHASEALAGWQSWRNSAWGRDWAWGTIVYCYQGQITFPFNFPLENKSSFFVFGGLSFNLRLPS